jgi:modulator of FtsH protease HflC
MGRGIGIFIGIIAVAAILMASGAFYIIDETQQVVLTQFGELVGKPQTKAGLYFKTPFIQVANYFDKRVKQWDGDANQIPTLEKRFIWVDTTARWRIIDPLKFMQSVRTDAAAQTRLDDLIDASTRAVVSSHKLNEIVRNTNRILQTLDTNTFSNDQQFGRTVFEPIEIGRDELSRKILARAAPQVIDYGIELIDVRIKRINYIQEVQRSVYERMISERKRAAEQYRSEGQGKKAEIEGQMMKELNEIQSGAYKTAQEVKGKGDAEAIKIYAEAYNNDPEFYAFLKTLETYRRTTNKDTTLMLSTDSEYFRYLKDTKGQP